MYNMHGQAVGCVVRLGTACFSLATKCCVPDYTVRQTCRPANVGASPVSARSTCNHGDRERALSELERILGYRFNTPALAHTVSTALISAYVAPPISDVQVLGAGIAPAERT